MLTTLFISFIVLQGVQLEKCNLSACELLEMMTNTAKDAPAGLGGCNSMDLRWRQLDRRLRAIEQTTWTVTHSAFRWKQCAKDLCQCDTARRSLSCWRVGLTTLTANIIVPADLVKINLATNMLRSLHKTTFRGMRLLVELDVFDNRLEYLPAGIFHSLTSLKFLRLQRNHIEELESDIFRGLPKLVQLDLSNNFLHTLPEKLFLNNSLLDTIDMSNNRITNIPADTFSGLHSLRILDLSYNMIKRIANGTFVLKKLQILKLSDNNIENITESAFQHLQSLESLFLSKNKILKIPPLLFHGLRNLNFLYISENNVKGLTGIEFKHLTSLNTLDLKDNALTVLPDHTFSNCSWLERLDLSKNKLQYINASAFDGLTALDSLILSDNNIYEIHPKALFMLKNLSTLHLNSNLFPSLHPRTLDYMPKLISVKLSRNPWHCDCHALYISAWVRLNERKIWDSTPTCVSPWYLDGHFLNKLKFSDLCTGQWASMVNLSPRLPIKQLLALNVSVNRKPQVSMGENHNASTVDPWH